MHYILLRYILSLESLTCFTPVYITLHYIVLFTKCFTKARTLERSETPADLWWAVCDVVTPAALLQFTLGCSWKKRT